MVRQAWQDGTPLYPIGGGTQPWRGLRPATAGLGLSLGRLDKFVDYPARDLTITVEAGVTMAALAQRLGAERQRLPIDVACPARATLGGAVAANAAGPRQFRWGSMRDYVLGFRAVDGAGNIFGAGGRVVKNAAGYDLCRLLTGSHGVLGVLVQVTLMVRPMPETSAFVVSELRDVDAAEALLAGLVQTRTLPTAIELLVGPAWKECPALIANCGAGVSPASFDAGETSAPQGLVVGFEGSRAEVQWMVAELQDQWRRSGVASPKVIDGENVDPLWQRLSEGITLDSSNSPATALVAKIHSLPSVVVPMVRRLRELDPRVSIQSHAANGIIMARFSVSADETAKFVQQLLRPAVHAASGQMLIVSQPSASLDRDAVLGPEPPGWAVMQSIKNRFDPKGILNRGRFLFPSSTS